MTARIFCKVGKLKGLRQEFSDEVVLGRSSQCSLQLNVSMISARHARIYRREEGDYMIEDLGSTNGTELDGIRVREPEPLGHLHVITLADTYDLIFQDLERCSTRHLGRAPRGKTLDPAAIVEEREKTRSHEVMPMPPPVLGEATPRNAPAAAAPPEGAVGDRTEIHQELPLMPGLLAYSTTEPEPSVEELTGERTSLELELPLALPDFLGQAPQPPLHQIADTVDLEDALPPEDPTSAGPPAEPPLAEPPPVEEPPVREAPIEEPPDERPPFEPPPLDEPTPREPSGSSPVSQSRVMELLLDEQGPIDEQVFAPVLELESPSGEIQRFPLPPGDSVLGRGTEATLRIDSLEISRRHALLQQRGGRVWISDLKSVNHTYVDDVMITESIEITYGASLRFGRLIGRLVRGEES